VKKLKRSESEGKIRCLNQELKEKVKVKVTEGLSTEREPQVKRKCAVGTLFKLNKNSPKRVRPLENSSAGATFTSLYCSNFLYDTPKGSKNRRNFRI
jgi:hypothetical protein